MEKIYAEEVAPKGSVEPDRFKVNTNIKPTSKADIARAIVSSDKNLVLGSSTRGEIRVQPLENFDRTSFGRILDSIGLRLIKIIKPYLPGSKSDQLDTFATVDSSGNQYFIVLGKGKGSTLKVETHALNDLREQVEAILANPETKEGFFYVKIKDEKIKVNGVSNTPGTPKCDFSLDFNNKPVIFISHKGGSRASHINQYGGVTDKAGTDIKDHEEVQSFIADVKKEFPNGVPRRGAIFRKINSDRLKLMSIYGVDYGSDYGINNVHVVLQGRVLLDKTQEENTYKLQSLHALYNGDIPKEGDPYEPVLYARYSRDRGQDVPYTRLSIHPKGAASSRAAEKDASSNLNSIDTDNTSLEDELGQVV